MKTKTTPRDELLKDLQFRFQDVSFKKSERYNRKNKEAIWVDKVWRDDDASPLILSPSILHPDLDVILEKYDAWVEPLPNPDEGYFIYIKCASTYSKDEIRALFNPLLIKKKNNRI